ncbi:MAG: ATP-binding protein [Alphaproteobacteria bacterium]
MALNVLLIEDDDIDRMAIRRHLLKMPDVRLTEASTGAEAAVLLEKGGFHCVFVDYRLPDMDGVELLQKFYNIDTGELPAPFVMLTGQGNEKVMEEALRWGAHDYVVKSNLSADTISIALKKSLQLSELRKSRRQAEQMLLQAQKMDAVGQLTSGIAHDFNNLLTVILGNTRLLHRKLEKDDVPKADLAAKVTAIDEAAKKGAALVRHLMVFTRERELKPAATDLNHTVGETLDMLRRIIPNTIEIEVQLGDIAGPVMVDPGQLEHAIINISVNARDAMPQGGKLTILTKPADDGFAALCIRDTGTGMPEHVRQRMFEPFYTTKPAGQGTGLGLAMVYGFIQQSGGKIDVESEEGRGTLFCLQLPPAKVQDEKETAHG